MPDMPATSQLDWLSSMTAMIVLFWSRATRDLLKSFGWGIAGTPSIRYSDEVAISRRPPHSIYRSRSCERLSAVIEGRCRTDKLDGVIKHRSPRAATMVGRRAALHGPFFLGGTDGSN